MEHPAAVNASSAAVLYPAKNGGTEIFSFFSKAISFSMSSNLALRLAQVFAEAFSVELLFPFVFVVLECVLVDFVEVAFVVVVFNVVGVALVSEVTEVPLEVGEVELDVVDSVEDEADAAATSTFTWAVVVCVVPVTVLELEAVELDNDDCVLKDVLLAIVLELLEDVPKEVLVSAVVAGVLEMEKLEAVAEELPEVLDKVEAEVWEVFDKIDDVAEEMPEVLDTVEGEVLDEIDDVVEEMPEILDTVEGELLDEIDEVVEPVEEILVVTLDAADKAVENELEEPDDVAEETPEVLDKVEAGIWEVLDDTDDDAEPEEEILVGTLDVVDKAVEDELEALEDMIDE